VLVEWRDENDERQLIGRNGGDDPESVELGIWMSKDERSGCNVATAATARAPCRIRLPPRPRPLREATRRRTRLPRHRFIVDDHDANGGYCRHQRTISNEWRKRRVSCCDGLSDSPNKGNLDATIVPPLTRDRRRSYGCSRTSARGDLRVVAQTNASRTRVRQWSPRAEGHIRRRESRARARRHDDARRSPTVPPSTSLEAVAYRVLHERLQDEARDACAHCVPGSMVIVIAMRPRKRAHTISE